MRYNHSALNKSRVVTKSMRPEIFQPAKFVFGLIHKPETKDLTIEAMT